MTAESAQAPSIETVIARGYLRMVLLAVGLCALALTIIGGYLIRGYADQTLELAARTVSYSVEPALVFGDATGVQDALRSVGSMDAVRKIEVYSLDGRAMGQWETGSASVSGSLYPMVDKLFWPSPRMPEKRDGNLRIFDASCRWLLRSKPASILNQRLTVR